MRKYMFLIMAIFSVNVFAGVITEKELNSEEILLSIYHKSIIFIKQINMIYSNVRMEIVI